MNESNQKLFEQYLNGALSMEDKLSFENRLKEDSRFRSDFELFNSMEDFLAEKNENKDALASIRSVGETIKKEKHEPEKKNGIIKLIALLAACGLLLILAYQFLNEPKVEEFRQFAEVYEEPIWPIERSDSTEIAAIITKYKQGDKPTAFNNLYKANSIDNAEKAYWLAELHLIENNPDSTLLYIPLAKDFKVKRDRLTYLQALSYLKKNELDLFKSFSEKLPTDLDPYYRKRINRLLE